MLLVQVHAANRYHLLCVQLHTCLNLQWDLKNPFYKIQKRLAQVVTVSQITSFETGGETSGEVAKRPGIETSKGAKRPGRESSKVVAKRPGDELAK